MDLETKWNILDKPGYLALLREDAKIKLAKTGEVLSKSECAKELPKRMRKLGPMKFVIHKICVKGDTATVELSVSAGDESVPYTLTFSRSQNKWLLKSSSY